MPIHLQNGFLCRQFSGVIVRKNARLPVGPELDPYVGLSLSLSPRT